MFKRIFSGSIFQMNIASLGWLARVFPALSLSMVFLLIEFFDELHYTVDGAALPAIRADLGLSYAQVGLLLGLPHLLSLFIEPAIMLLGDTGLRRRLVLGGGLAIVLGLGLTAGAGSFPVLLLAACLNYPASGAFVTLSQATLMDQNHGREAQAMARWTVAGSLGNVLGPLLVAGLLALGLGWRPAFLGLAVLVVLLLGLVSARPFPGPMLAIRSEPAARPPAITRQERLVRARLTAVELLRSLWSAVRNPRLLRWFFLLEFSDMLLDVLTDYLPLYFVDVIGATPAQAGLLLSVLLLAGLASDLALIPLLERVPGRKLVRASAALALLAYPAFLLAPWLPLKIALLVAVRFTTLGWYPVLEGEAFATLPGRAGTVKAASAVGGLIGGGMVWGVGYLASLAGLPAAMWLLLLGPLALVLFLPRHTPA